MDNQYNPRLSVVDVEKYFETWRRDSLLAKAVIPRFDIDLAFGPTRGQRLDVFYGYANSPAVKSDEAPTLVFIHGGYWRALDKRDFSFIAKEYAACGVNVVITNYDLCPSVSLREICLQQCYALAWIYRNSPTLGLNKNKIVVSGHSAGGHLSAMLLATKWPSLASDLPIDLVKGAIALSGLFDLRDVAKAPFLANDLQLTDTEAIALSPVFMPPATTAPLLTAVGELESNAFHHQTSLIESAWKDNFQVRIPAIAANHFSICDRFATPSDELFKQTLALLQAI